MSETVKFEVWAETSREGSRDVIPIEVHPANLEGVPEDEWETFVWKNLGGEAVAFEMCAVGISRISGHDED